MSNEISAVPKTIPSAINETANLMKGMGLSEKATQAVKDVAAIFSSRSVNVSNAASGASGTQDVGRASGATSIPALDNPADIKQMEAALEKLIAYLQLDNEERQAEMAKERIEVQKDTLSAEHKERKEKIDDSLKKMDEAAKSRLISRIFGWIGAIVAVAAAVAATVITGGAAAGFAIAGAVIAVSALVMSETGATDALTKALAETLESAGMSKKNAQLFAALAINIAIMALSLSCSIGGMVSGLAQISKAAADTFSTVAKVVQSATSIGSAAVGLGSLAAGVSATALGYKSDMAQADVSELEKIMAELQRRLDESEEELNAILEAIQNGLGQIAAILDSATDTQSEIADKIGMMA